jgi:hypothetical protein
MTISERIRQKTKPGPSRNIIRGEWFNIRFCPDLATGELLNIGVGFVDESGRVYNRILNDFSRLRCLYDDRIDLEEIAFLAEIIGQLLDRTNFSAIEHLQPSPNIKFSQRKYAAGQGINSIIDRLYRDTVTLDWPRLDKVTEKSRFKPHDNHTVRKDVFSKLRDLMGYDAEKLISKDSQYTIPDGDIERKLDLPLRSDAAHLTGTIASAWYKDLYRAEHNILTAAMDLRTAKRFLDKDKFGLFILRPDLTSGLTESDLCKMEDAIDRSVWQLQADDIHIGIESKTDRLAQDIVTWHNKAA